MGLVRISTGVEIPNANMEAKTDGLGMSGLPDGWTKGTAVATDLTLKVLPLHIGDVSLVAPELLGNGRALYAKNNSNYGTSNQRFIQTPRSRAHFFGAEQMVSGSYWKYRLRCIFRGIATGGTPASGVVALIVRVYDSTETNLFSASLSVVGADWNTGWKELTSTFVIDAGGGWSPAVGNPDHCYVLLNFGTAPGVGITIEAMFSRITIESIGPVDAATGSETLGSTLTWYEISKNPQWKGLELPRQMKMGKGYRLASGSRRYFDPTGGVTRRAFAIPWNILSRDDYRRLYLLWQANKGYSQDSGTKFGKPLPLVLIPNQPDTLGSYYVDVVDDHFPLTYDDEFQSSAESAQRYRGTFHFEER